MSERAAGRTAGIEACVRILRARSGLRPRLHFVLGSGLGGVADSVRDPVVVPFCDLPGFPETSVSGHAGRFVLGCIDGVPVLVQAGRYHFYEGWGGQVVARPVRVGHAFGARILVLTNAAGGIRRDLVPGTFMLVDDHLNLAFRTPLAGPLREGEARFPDVSRPYDPALAELAAGVARRAGVPLTRGVYGMVLGPNFETRAEIRALRAGGADAVGMSTVPEVVIARALGQRVLAISLITNRAAGLGPGDLCHEEVMALGASAGKVLGSLLKDLVPPLAASSGASDDPQPASAAASRVLGEGPAKRD